MGEGDSFDHFESEALHDTKMCFKNNQVKRSVTNLRNNNRQNTAHNTKKFLNI